MSEILATIVAPLLGLGGLVYAFLTYRDLVALPDGDEKMREIASSIHDGAMVFLKREYRIISIFCFGRICSISVVYGYIYRLSIYKRGSQLCSGRVFRYARSDKS